MKRRYWVVSPNVLNDGNTSYWLKKSKDENKVFVGYGSDKKLGERFETTVAVKDCVIIAQGAKDNRTLYRIGIINSSRQFEEINGVFYRDVDYLLSEKDILDNKIELNSNNAFFESNNPGTIYELKRENKFDKSVMDKIESAFKLKLKLINMNDKIELLEYKKQIILQGPPGTGKTRLAKMMAEEMTKANKIGSPIDVINNYFKTYKPDASRIALREKINGLVSNFQEKFKKENLKNLPLEDYALGTDDKDGFCYWQEYILTDTGKYNGQADKGKIYWKSDEQKYVKSGFLKTIEDDNEAMKKMGELLDNIVYERHNQGVDYPIGKGFILKMLNTYYPDKYFPINNEKCLTNALKLLRENTTGLNYIQKNIRLQELFLEKKEQYKADITNNEFMYFLFTYDLNGEIKFEKSELIVEGKYKIVQFHPSYSYEDFVRGITAKTNENGDINYNVENRILVGFANEALDNPKGKYVLIIDEINRANLPSVLGELIYALEYRYFYDKDNLKEASVESIYDISVIENEPNRVVILPENLYIIGTMNTSDRSVGHIDYAIKRRFAFVDVLPEIEPVHPLIKEEFVKISSLFIKNFDGITIPQVIEKSDSLASDFRTEDIWIGHSYFICKKDNSNINEDDAIAKPILNMKLKYEIIPLLKEYIKDGILNESEQVKKIMNELISKDFTK